MDNHITPTPYQTKIIEDNWAAYLRGRVYDAIFDKPGVGKTICYVEQCKRIRAHRVQQGKRRPVVWQFTENRARNSQRDKWFMFDKSLDPNDPLSVMVLEGTAQERSTQIEMAAMLRIPVVVMNYRQGCLHIDDLMQWVSDDDVFLADEVDLASPSGSNESQTNYMARAMACKCFHRILSTGTCMRNRVDTLANLFVMGNPTWIHQEEVEFGNRLITLPLSDRSASWGTKANICERYGVWDGERLVGVQRKEELHERLIEWGASLNDQDVLGIDKAEPQIITHPLSEGQQINYNHAKIGLLELAEELASALYYYSGRDERFTKSVLGQMANMRYVCGLSPKNYKRLVQLHKAKRLEKADRRLAQSLIDHLDLNKLTDTGGNSRVDAAINLMATFDWDDGGGVYLFSPFKEVVNEIASAVKRYDYAKYGFGLMTGDTPQVEQDRILADVASGSVRIVAATSVGGRSIDMQGLNWSGNLVPPWTASEVEQATARVSRFGQERQVRPFYFGAQNTIEDKFILPLMAGKGKDADDVYSGKRGRRHMWEAITDVTTLSKYL